MLLSRTPLLAALVTEPRRHLNLIAAIVVLGLTKSSVLDSRTQQSAVRAANDTPQDSAA